MRLPVPPHPQSGHIRVSALSEQAETFSETGTAGERREAVGAGVPTKSTTVRSADVLRGAVYVVEAKGLGLVKIGMAADIPTRLRLLQNMCPARLIVLAAIHSNNPYSDEISLHIRFAKDRRHGEWFTATDEITDWAWHDSKTGVAHRARAQAACDAVWFRREEKQMLLEGKKLERRVK